jgi:N-acetylglucosamine-6-phosphate deacetylase
VIFSEEKSREIIGVCFEGPFLKREKGGIW